MVCLYVLVVRFEDMEEFVEFSLVDLLNHIVLIFCVVEEGPTLACRQQCLKVVKVLVEEGCQHLFWTERLHILLLGDAEQLPDASEYHRGEVIELEDAHFGLVTSVLASLSQPIILPPALLLELPVGQVLPWQLRYVIERSSYSYQDIEDLVKLLAF